MNSTKYHYLKIILTGFIIITGSSLISMACIKHNQTDDLKLWYDEPARDWMTQALPIGNGFMGAMIFGGVDKERIQFNEESLWAGGPGSHEHYNGGQRTGAYKYLPKVRELLKRDRYDEAHQLATKRLTGIIDKNQPKSKFYDFGAYQSFGDLYIETQHKSEITHYYRDLNISNSTAHVKYASGDIHYERIYFANYPDRVLVFHFKNDADEGVDYKIRLKFHHKSTLKFIDNQLIATGVVENNNMAFMLKMRIRNDGGNVFFKDEVLSIKNTHSISLIMTAATDYLPEFPLYKGKNYHSVVDHVLKNISEKSIPELLDEHINDYQKLFNRVTLDLGSPEKPTKPTDKRLSAYHEGSHDPAFESLLFQYGRYLLISSSRPGTLPANLQGKWNDKNAPPWACDYHTNINLQMNYWPAEVTNLSECHLPMFEFMKSLVEPGQNTAKQHYNARGWVAHTMINIFGYTAPGWKFPWGYFPGGAAWLCQHLWEHYAFTQDKEFLRQTAFPLMKGAALFWLDYLTGDEDGTLVSMPSYSPEHGGISRGASMDHQIVWDLFTNCISACKILTIETEFQQQLSNALDKLSPPQIGKWGQLQEWKEDLDDPNNHHRHVSQLFALHPGKQITIQQTPELAKAAKTSLEARGDEGTGWSLAWKINFWARLLDGNRAHKLIKRLLTPTEDQGRNNLDGGGTYHNLFNACPPLQIDGNLGVTAGIAEMLLQSHAGEIHLLPALPAAWPNGSIKGLCARGGFVVDICWKNSLFTKAKVFSKTGSACRIRYGDKTILLKTEKGESYRLNHQLFGRILFEGEVK